MSCSCLGNRINLWCQPILGASIRKRRFSKASKRPWFSTQECIVKNLYIGHHMWDRDIQTLQNHYHQTWTTSLSLGKTPERARVAWAEQLPHSHMCTSAELQAHPNPEAPKAWPFSGMPHNRTRQASPRTMQTWAQDKYSTHLMESGFALRHTVHADFARNDTLRQSHFHAATFPKHSNYDRSSWSSRLAKLAAKGGFVPPPQDLYVPQPR